MIQNSKFKIQNSPQAAFTLIEMLVVVFVLGIGLIGALSFFNINLNNQFEAKNELIAAGLAQEGLELVRNIRDYNVLNSDDPFRPNWYSLLWSKVFNFSLCNSILWSNYIDYRSLDTHTCQMAQNDDIYYRGGRYRHRPMWSPSWDPYRTNYKRTILIEKIGDLDAGGYLEVTCTVTWNDRTTVAKDTLYANQF